MNIPVNLKYTRSHEWIEFTGEKTAKVGITDFAQNSLGGIVFVNLPDEGDSLEAGDSLGEVESVKAVSDVYSPVTGVVYMVNEGLLGFPEKINEAPYDSWLVEISNISAQEELLNAAEYEALCQKEV